MFRLGEDGIEPIEYVSSFITLRDFLQSKVQSSQEIWKIVALSLLL